MLCLVAKRKRFNQTMNHALFFEKIILNKEYRRIPLLTYEVLLSDRLCMKIERLLLSHKFDENS